MWNEENVTPAVISRKHTPTDKELKAGWKGQAGILLSKSDLLLQSKFQFAAHNRQKKNISCYSQIAEPISTFII